MKQKIIVSIKELKEMIKTIKKEKKELLRILGKKQKVLNSATGFFELYNGTTNKDDLDDLVIYDVKTGGL